MSVGQHHEYRQRLAALAETVAQAQLDPAAQVHRAAGLLAGRVGCRVDEAHTYLLDRAAQQGRPAAAVAGDILMALQGRPGSGSRPLDAEVDKALHPQGRSPSAERRLPPHPPSRAVDDWGPLVQHVLEAMPGNHMALSPVFGDGSEITDWVIVAVSQETADFSGRDVAQAVGRRITQAYPATVDTPVWQAWLDVAADGCAREVGPFPYVGRSARAPAEVLMTAWVSRVGPGVLSRWVRHDEQTRQAERIAQTERLGQLGWGEADLVTGQIVWSDELYRIYERDPALGPMSSEEQNAVTVPEDEPIRRQAAEGFGRGDTVDVTTRIRVGGRVKHVRSVVDAVRDVQGRPVKVYGIVQDVTMQHTSRAQLAEAEQLLQQHQNSLAAEHELAAQLRQIVLPVPAEPFDLPGLRVAVRYLPAEEASRVGGDWFHAALADDGSVVLAVGDVAGHGMHAATVMAELRHMLAGLTVTTTTDPAQLLWHLNRLLYSRATTATAVVARFDPQSRSITWAQGGHPKPLHARAGTTTELAAPRGTLLGAVRAARYDTATVSLAPADLLLFYTDGLIEHRRHTLAEGLAPVITTLDDISASGSRQPLADLLMRLRRANPEDDTCILAVRHHTPVPPDPPEGDHA
ncbi:SpoIIE family protein phosphatase [Paractinoplanes hotanensis]|uniref:SpoIIE family protein phosphatase n=1 Tax=Paractinoplanes hotanensis TaxID=2906497 RepID=A0ABT0XYK1_9ACTN|nr:SpoIIE family protein phosphatase [Actinoplanes hotanensis]MCM4078876.1 SpoIIE family protein phosphatase [Actinoplanes hotanensis]